VTPVTMKPCSTGYRDEMTRPPSSAALLRLNPRDPLAVALRDLAPGESLEVEGVHVVVKDPSGSGARGLGRRAAGSSRHGNRLNRVSW
jgi:hypothetical protein